MENKFEQKTFEPVAIHEFIDNKLNFFIPSYQRGYRWDKKQVVDLLEDIHGFITKSDGKSFYCLQPIVVSKKVWMKDGEEYQGWEVIDGQQRLTTMLLLLKHLTCYTDAEDYKDDLYNIHYQTRPNIDFDNVDPKSDIDSFYINNSNEIINTWFTDNKKIVSVSKFIESLFKDIEKTPKIKFIWYEVVGNNNVSSIRTFNNLNKGKISLTSSELIKALMILNAQSNNNLDINEISYVWTDIESRLHDSRFWWFLSNSTDRYSTRIDLLFDFLTNKDLSSDDRDYSYRQFQNLLDNKESDNWTIKDIKNLKNAWDATKTVYKKYKYWFEDNVLYQYVGFLVSIGVSLKDIYNECVNKNKNEIVISLKGLIRKKVNDNNDLDFSELDYNDKRTRQLLLLFNIETYINQGNVSHISHNRFPFDLYKIEKWDVEHIVSQTENKLQNEEDKKVWLNYIHEIIFDDEVFGQECRVKAAEILSEISNNKNIDKEFEELHEKMTSQLQPNMKTTDNIQNLALLDAGTNRAYKNALFPTKRKFIIERDKQGKFVPICTKNMFLKYYTANDKNTSQWKNTWTQNDANSYLKSIKETLSWITKN